ncbi:hypothetical protein HBI56_185470 [Parastagonospora nodorum]|nr:hypothetical protein HBH51_099670 [Parastagonospora nodorum]KAH4020676.1 hypothetical protein HBI09_178520 [Parastagonospora nodorum]KAH4064449.1 hypothetical protein HBH50_179400 [Parastagonospora nodorum]KAH4084130.1 hypothetical protein HBH48_165100 [Parastagonospora nodorum]KAH4159968.1 hypothetical protein HBH43_179860 [Parastagonospora nodorum]
MTSQNGLSPLAQPFESSQSASGSDDGPLNPHAQPFTAKILTPDSTPAHFDMYVSKETNLPFATAYPNVYVPGICTIFPPAMPSDRVDLRLCHLKDRKAFEKGERVLICKGNIALVDLPGALFLATSTKPELLIHGLIKLPHDIDARGVVLLIAYINKMVSWRHNDLRMRHHEMEIYDMLSVTAAAALLGMEQYTAHIYRKCEAVLHNDLPSYDDIDAVTYFAREHPRMLYILASNNLAKKMRENQIPDVEDFTAYLSYNHILNEQIQMAHTRHADYVSRSQKREQEEQDRIQRANKTREYHERAKASAIARAQQREQWEQGREEREQEQAKRAKEREQHKKDKAEEDKKYWAKKKEEATVDEKSVLEKVKLAVDKRKFTLRERAHWRKTRGTKLPKGC